MRQAKTAERHVPTKVVANIRRARSLVPYWVCNARMLGADSSSIMRTVESLLTNAVKRFVGRICDLAETCHSKWLGPRSQKQPWRKESR
jgi:hypothetical protein